MRHQLLSPSALKPMLHKKRSHLNEKLFTTTRVGHESSKLEVVKQEMTRVNVDILRISELNGLEWVNLLR